MIIIVNTLGVKINIIDSIPLTKRFGTQYVTLPIGSIDTISIVKLNELGDIVQIEDSIGDDYYVHHTEVTSINGASTFTDVESVFNAISDAVLNI